MWRRIALLLWVPAALAHPHTAPAAWCDIEIADREVALVLTVRREVLGPWVGLDLSEDLPPVDAALRRSLEAVFVFKNVLSVDGERRSPRVASIEIPEDLDDPRVEEYLRIRLVTPCRTPARRVTLLWQTFAGADWQKQPVVPGVVTSGPEKQVFALSATEPEYTWHRSEARPPPAPVPVPTGTEGAVPFLSLGLFLLAAAGAVLLRRRQAVALALLLAGAVSAAYAWPAGPPADARRIFQALHESVYRAFEAKTEDGIYDVLARSVDAGLLQEIYLDIYESLVLREQGGVITEVEEVEVIGGDVSPGGSATEFAVAWRWRVHCSISHWGHVHRRINVYAANYTVRHDGTSWKIAGVAVREYERVDPDAER
jgi:LPXTG-motif cell wall-anchored protein